MRHILVVDDKPNMVKTLGLVLRREGYEITTATRAQEAVEIAENRKLDLLITDLKMPDMDGLELMSELKSRGHGIPFIVISGFGTIERAVEAMKMGAIDFITKPFNKDMLRHKISNYFGTVGEQAASGSERCVYRSAAMQEIMATVQRVAAIPRPVLLVGESGTGKEEIARRIHTALVGDGDGPFVSINSPAVPEPLFESELFGHKRGAFTNADSDYPGKAKLAEGGTLFLDEIAELPLSIQPKLLRFLDGRRFTPLGGTEEVHTDARIVCATNRNLDEMIEQGSFRQDLFYRINTIVIRVPPLRERPEDVAPLVEHFNDRLAAEIGSEPKLFAADAVEVLERYDWPGNVRELRNVIERINLMSSSREIHAEDLPEEIRTPAGAEAGSGIGGEDLISKQEKSLLLEALRNTNWNLTRTARELGISRSAIRWRIKKYDLTG